VALVTDGMISTLEDLLALDSAILETSVCEKIDLSKKLRVAEQTVQLELAVFLLRAQNQNGSSGPGVDLGNVVVTNPLRRWHALRTLSEFYSDAYNSQFNDRYLGKWKHYSKLTRETSDLLFDYGVGITGDPVPRPSKPKVEAVGAGGLVTQYYVQTAWRGRLGAAGALSEMVVFSSPNGELLAVEAGSAPAGVTGFLVYVGEAPDALTLQTAVAVATGGTWFLPVSGLVDGAAPPDDQRPDYYVRRNRTR